MAKRLTEGQKKARAAVRRAAREVIRRVDEMNWRKECVEFAADFHLSCIRYDKAKIYGEPCAMDYPVYSGHIVCR